MAMISVFAAKHADKAHILEFFLKNLLNPGERPIAFFDGFFYEAKHERVGGLSFQDYLIFSDKSVYFWARGPQKDYLDRFNLGAVSFTSKEKENDISTVDITVNRKGKNPIFLVFDFVPSDEAEKIVMLNVLFETAIEKEMGRNYWDEIPKETAETIFDIGRETYPPVEIEFIDYQQPPSIEPSFAGTSHTFTRPSLFGPSGSGQGADQNIGYGQNLLEQFKMTREINGYHTANHPQQEGATPQGAHYQPPFSNPFQQQAPFPGVFPFENAFGNFGRENPQNNWPQQFTPPVGPTVPGSQGAEAFPEVDIVTLKRMGALVKDIIHSIPEEYREQAKHTLRMIPENLEKLPSNAVQVISALNELLENVSNNKQTQDFLIRSIGTAVRNDGLIGMTAKLMKTLLPPAIYKQKSQHRRETQKTAWDSRQQPHSYEQAKRDKSQSSAQQHEPPLQQVQKEQKTAESQSIWDTAPAGSDAGNEGYLSRRKKIKIKPES